MICIIDQKDLALLLNGKCSDLLDDDSYENDANLSLPVKKPFAWGFGEDLLKSQNKKFR